MLLSLLLANVGKLFQGALADLTKKSEAEKRSIYPYKHNPLTNWTRPNGSSRVATARPNWGPFVALLAVAVRLVIN